MRKTTTVHRDASLYRERQLGMALLVVLWVVALMVLLVLVFSNTVQVSVRTATYRKEAAQAHSLAWGGVQAAVLEIAYPPSEGQKPSPLWAWQHGQRAGVVPFQDGQAELQVVNESGKVDLNFASQTQLLRLFAACDLAPARAERMAQALVDWRTLPPADAQNGPPPGGGEHAPFESVEEVTNVPGISRDVFFGRADVDARGGVRTEFGAARDLTVRSKMAQININYASEAALESVPGITGSFAQAIVRARSQEPFKTVVEIGDRTGESVPDEALSFLTTAESNTYTIVSTGVIKDSPVRRTVEAVIQLAPLGALRYRIVAWYDDYWNQ